MKKLFEIPIYAFSPEMFKTKVTRYKQSLVEEFHRKHNRIDNAEFREWMFCLCHPFQLWNYNHIVGYIVLLSDGVDVVFELYLQAHEKLFKSRYYWRSTRKWFLENQGINGFHFRIDENDSSDAIREKIYSWLEKLIKEYIPSKYYIDREAFDSIAPIIDYSDLGVKE